MATAILPLVSAQAAMLGTRTVSTWTARVSRGLQLLLSPLRISQSVGCDLALSTSAGGLPTPLTSQVCRLPLSAGRLALSSLDMVMSYPKASTFGAAVLGVSALMVKDLIGETATPARLRTLASVALNADEATGVERGMVERVVPPAPAGGGPAPPPRLQWGQQFAPAARARLPPLVRLLVREARVRMHCGPSNDSPAQRMAVKDYLYRMCVERGVTRTYDLHWILPMAVSLSFAHSETDWEVYLLEHSEEYQQWHPASRESWLNWIRTRLGLRPRPVGRQLA